MGEPRSGKIVFGEREYLGLILQPAECAGKDDAIAIPLKIGPARLAARGLGTAELICGEKLRPMHRARVPEEVAGRKRKAPRATKEAVPKTPRTVRKAREALPRTPTAFPKTPMELPTSLER